MFDKVQKLFLLTVAGLFPLFFLTITQEYYITNKVFFLSFAMLLFLIISSIRLFFSKKIIFHVNIIDIAIGLFLAALTASILISSPNKMEALMTPSFGLITYLSAVLFYFFVSYKKLGHLALQTLSYTAVIVSVLQIIFSLHLFAIPKDFTPLGTQIESLLFLGFFTLYMVVELLSDFKKNLHGLGINHVLKQIMFLTILIATLITSYIVYTSINKPIATSQSSPQTYQIAPVSVSLGAALYTLHQPKTALFGAGVDNFVTAFSQAKTREYASSVYWATTFNQSSGFFLHILTETGVLGFFALLLIIVCAFYKLVSHRHTINTFVLLSYLVFFIIIFIFFPPSLITLFLFFIILSLLPPEKRHSVDLSEYIIPYHLPLGLAGIGIAIFLLYFLSRLYAAEWYFKQSIDGLARKDGKVVYTIEKKAIGLAPYVERYRISFSQVNLLIANSIITAKNQKLTEQDRQQIIQSIQQAISEAKSAVSLNPQKSTNWENLGLIYQNITSVVKGSDVWAISSYQRAVNADPSNPLLRLNFGGLYYKLGSYSEAVKTFEQAVKLKPNWANGYYNLAWAYHQNKEDEKAIVTIDKVLALIDKNSPDYKKAVSEQESFKKSLNENKNKKTTEQTPTPGILDLSVQPINEPVLPPLFEVPTEASPEVK